MKRNKILGCRVSEAMYDDINKICDVCDVKVSSILFVLTSSFLEAYKNTKNEEKFNEVINHIKRLENEKNKVYEVINLKGGFI